MASEQLLKTTLALYHETPIPAQAPQQRQQQLDRLFAQTTALLTTLTNPRNICLVTMHFLRAPTLWPVSSGAGEDPAAAARVCYRVVSVYNTAALHVRRRTLAEAAAARHGLAAAAVGGARADRRPDPDTWAHAVAGGAADAAAAPRWRHLLVLVGVLVGCEGGGGRREQQTALSRSRRLALEAGVVAAANLALAEGGAADDNDAAARGRFAVVLALQYAFPLLADHARAALRADLLLPCIVDALTGPYGFQDGRVLDAVATDPQLAVRAGVVHWPAASASFLQLQQRDSDPAASLVPGAGPVVATLAAFAVQALPAGRGAAAAATTAAAVVAALDRLVAFADAVAARWWTGPARRLSGTVDLSAEGAALSAETAQTTWPALWQHLRKMLYAAAVLLQALVGRSLLDGALATDALAPRLAAGALRVLRGLFFVSSRDGAGQFQAYQFAYLASLDVLARYPAAAAAFLEEMVPPPPPPPPPGAASADDYFLRRTADLFYLNVAEHFAAVLPPAACDRLLVQPALPYLVPDGGGDSHARVSAAASSSSPHRVEVFEAAHSAVLAVLSCPHNAALAAALGPFYAEALFASFPGRISPRQFRLAFATLLQILSPPFPVYATHPALAETLLEMVRFRAAAARASPDAQRVLVAAAAHDDGARGGGGGGGGELVSEQSTLVLTLIDALPFLALPVLEEWMTTVAETLWTIGGDARLRQAAQRRFWEVLGSGEMDVERAARGVAWWGNGGGGALVLTGRRPGRGPGRPGLLPGRPADAEEELLMSGALPDGQTARL